MNRHIPIGSPHAAIANHVVRVASAFTGRGPTQARAYLVDDLVTVVLRDNLTAGERILVERDRAQEVTRIREAFQETMRDELVAGVEEILGRKVIAFLSANRLDPDIAVETFLLEPESDRAGEKADAG